MDNLAAKNEEKRSKVKIESIMVEHFLLKLSFKVIYQEVLLIVKKGVKEIKWGVWFSFTRLSNEIGWNAFLFVFCHKV